MVVLVLASMNNNNILLELWHVFQDTDCRVALLKRVEQKFPTTQAS
jgi:hypothetical protein